MAILSDRSTGAKHVLRPYHVFGRSPGHVNCLLLAADVSLIHACARWSDGQWTLTDQSRNGSFVNGLRLAKDVPTPMRVGDEVRFGTPQGHAWQVDDLSPPADLLLPVAAGARTITLDPVQNLPNDAVPAACLYRAIDGQWLLETQDGVTPLDDGDPVSVGEDTWRLVCAAPLPGTLAPVALAPCMKFDTSLDEEHVRLTLTRGLAREDLGERSHHYLLLLLARQRLADVARAFDPHARGWVEFERLVKWLGMDKAHLNIQIFRLRKQFEPVVSRGLIQQDFVERRRGGVRLGNVGVEIWKGSVLEGRYEPEGAVRAGREAGPSPAGEFSLRAAAATAGGRKAASGQRATDQD